MRIMTAFWAALLAVSLALPAGAAQVAASIEYDTMPRPAGLPDAFQPTGGASLQFLAIKAIDGYRIEGALWTPHSKAPADTTLIVMIHGSGDNYHHGPTMSLAHDLSPRGYAALSINTRQHDDLINADNFFDVRRDIEAAVETARALGYHRLVLYGHSLGNIQVQYYAATDWSPDIRAVILTGTFGNLPWKTRNLLIQDETSYRALADEAMKSMKDDTLGKYLPDKMRYLGGQNAAVTGQHFLTYRLEGVSVADGTYWIHRIPHPILIARDQADGIVQPFEPYMLLSAAHAQDSLVTSIKYVLVPDARPPSADGHSFIGNEQRLTDTVAAWLADQHL
ncbi:MAG TPA: alpha/beta fold hydrolase [Stellaceae bacterium]|nr:alpha/beta fold hydrolase [Stellaceae bacterium]